MGAHCAEHATASANAASSGRYSRCRRRRPRLRQSGMPPNGFPDTAIAAGVDVAEAGKRRAITANPDHANSLGLQFALAESRANSRSRRLRFGVSIWLRRNSARSLSSALLLPASTLLTIGSARSGGAVISASSAAILQAVRHLACSRSIGRPVVATGKREGRAPVSNSFVHVCFLESCG